MQNEEELKQILAGLQERQQPVPIWQRIIESVARGIGTAGSERPGDALLQQIKEKGAERQERNKRQQDIANVATQFRLTDLANRMAEKRTISAEGRAETRDLAKEKRDKERDVEMYNLQLSGQKTLKGMDNDQAISMFNLSKTWESLMREEDREFALRRDEAQRKGNFEDQSKIAQQNLVYSLIASKVMDGEKVSGMMAKLRNGGEGLTADDMKLLNKAAVQMSDQNFTRQLRLQMAQRDGQFTGMERIQHEAAMAAMTSARTEELIKVQGPDGARLIPGRKDDLGKYIIPQGFKFVESADYGERLMYFYDQFGVTEKFRVGKKDLANLEATQTKGVNDFLKQIDQARKQGDSDETIKANLTDLASKSPKWADSINLALANDEAAQRQAKMDQGKSSFDDTSGPIGFLGRTYDKITRELGKQGTARWLRQELTKAKNKLDRAKTDSEKNSLNKLIAELESRLDVATKD
jgi:hypothetical protein